MKSLHARGRSSGRDLKLLFRLRNELRTRRYGTRTVKAYVRWVRRFVKYHGMRHPEDMSEPEVNAFLTKLAVRDRVSASTQTQALSALVFLHRHVIRRPLGELGPIARARKPARLPVALTRAQVSAVLGMMEGRPRLMASLLYGSGMRLLELLRLRVQHVDLRSTTDLVRDGKGAKDRSTILPSTLVDPLRDHLDRVRRIHQADCADGFGRVALPDAIDRKYPNASLEWAWQWVFPQ